MEHYILFSLFLLTIPTVFELTDKNGWKTGFWMCVTILMMLSALRGESVGNDTKTYINLFETYLTTPDADTRYEIGYVWLNKILGNISQNPQIIIITTSIFIFLSYGRFIYKYSKMPNLSLFIFFTFGYYTFAISGIRQSLAIAILFFGYKYIIEGKFTRFLLLIITASLFHSTAIFFIPAYFTRNLKCTAKNILIILLMGLLATIAFTSITSVAFQLFAEYEHYNDGIYRGYIRMASILYAIIFLLITITGYNLLKGGRKTHHVNQSMTKKNDSDNNMIILVAIATAIYIISFNLNIFDRVALYYGVFAIIILPNTIFELKPSDRLLGTIITVIFFFSHTAFIILKRPLWNSSFPYSFCF